MVKSYLKFEQSTLFGQICSASSNSVCDFTAHGGGSSSRPHNGRAYVGANEEVLTWDLKKADLLSRWRATDNISPVTVICQSFSDPDIFAVGYDDGKIRLWDSQTDTVFLTFNGHKSAVTQLRFDRSGVRLASGGRDTDIILWDLVNEVGLFKLRGHKDQITSLNFLSADDTDDRGIFLLTTSKDALIKIWDLSTQHCIETHIAQTNGECWALGLAPNQEGCITGGNSGELKAWVINREALGQASGEESSRILIDQGTFYRQGRDRTTAIVFHETGDVIAIHGAEKAVEIWRVRSEDEVRKSLVRKRKRRREKGEEVDETEPSRPQIVDVFVLHLIIRTGGKVRSMNWATTKGKFVSVLVATANNQLEVFDVDITNKKKEQPEYNRSISVDMQGHRTDVRCLALSSDDRMLASASHGSLKIWNTKTMSCLRTLDCGYALCTAFLPGDKIVIVGTRDGTLEIFDITSSMLLDTLDAHERDIWSIHVNPDGRSIVTGSADKCVKFWELKVIQEEVLGTNRKISKLTLVHARTLKTADDVLCTRFSPDGRLLAISTLDSTVKVFFLDSLKLFLTLYGHKLPVLSMDISYDSKLIVTCSADKNVRVWGLDFGDCHKAFFAHQDSILSVAFVPTNNDGNGHNFFSVSKDRVLKYFDGDKFEQIQKLDGHHGEIWAMAVAKSGRFVITASHDKSMRMWQQTDEQIFLEEERERELEELYENALVASLEEGDQDGEDDEAIDAGKQTAQTLIAGEKIAEALELGIEDLEVMREYQKLHQQNSKLAYPQRNPVFLANNNISASQYVYNVFVKIAAASLQDALLVLSYSQLPNLFTFLALWASEGRNIALTCRILFFMIKTHQKQIVSSELMRPMLQSVRDTLRQTLRQQRQELGFNLAGLRVTGRRLHELEDADYVDQDLWEKQAEQNTNRGTKRTFVSVA